MEARDRTEHHRQASWLELLFDLSFVVAVAQLAGQVEQYLIDGDVARGVTVYLMVFGAIWWAWMSFTWFANAFDNDDVSFRLLTMVVKLVGALCAMGAALLAPVLTVPGSVLLIGVIVVAVVACGARPDRAELSDGQDAGTRSSGLRP